MPRWYAPADYTAATMTDAHQLKFSKSQRLAQPGYGDNSRSLPWVETSCPQCTIDLDEPRNGFHRDPSKVNLTMSEQDWLTGRAQKSKTTIESLRAALDELELQ